MGDKDLKKYLQAVEDIIDKFGYVREVGIEVDDNYALALVELIEQIQELDGDYISRTVHATVITEDNGDGPEEFIEVRLLMGDDILVVSSDQLSPDDYAEDSFPVVVCNLITDVNDRAATIADKFYEMFTRKEEDV